MDSTVVTFISLVVMGFGTLVTIGFWVPGLVNRQRLKEILGRRYPLIYLIYGANGPFLLLLGLLLFLSGRAG